MRFHLRPLANDGLHSNNYHLTWVEIAETVDGLASIVKVLQGAPADAAES